MRRSVVCLVALVLVVAAAPVGASNDAYSNEQWNLAKIGAPSAWGVATGAGVRVGIVDSGIDAGHPDLAGHVVASVGCIDTNGSSSQCTSDAEDVEGHGSHVAGIIAATKDNGDGVAGVAPSAELVVARVFQPSGGDISTTYEDIVAGARWVVDHGARVVNFSLGDAGFFGLGLLVSNTDVKNVAAEVWSRGAIPVVAAGNNGCGSWSGTNAVVVTATGPSDEWAGYACAPTGAQWGVAAPGGDASSCDSQPEKCVLSTFARSKTPAGRAPYAYEQGTSMAAPVVAGALADLLQKGLSREDAIGTLLNTVDAASCGSGCKGRVNVARAVCGATCPAVVPSGGGNTNAPPPVTPTTARPVVRRATTPTTKKPVAAVTTTPPPAPTTTVEETTTTTTTAPPPTPELQSAAAAPKRTSNEKDIGPLPAILGILGLLGAIGATGFAAWRQRFRGGGAL